MPRSPLSLRCHLLGVLMIFGLLASPLTQAAFVDEKSRLSEFTPMSGPVRLHGTAENFDLYIPLADTVQLKDGWLDLSLSRSIALQPERSSFRIMFNETTLAQIPFNPDQPLAHARLRIPDELWRKGFNKLTLGVIQHYVHRYEDPNAPELWTEIDLHNSSLSYRIANNNDALQLHDLTEIFSSGIGGQPTVLMLSAPNTELDSNNSHLHYSLPLVTQALALYRDYAPLTVHHARWLDSPTEKDQAFVDAASYHPDANDSAHVLIGTRDELASALPDSLLARIQGPFLHLEYTKPTETDTDTRPPVARIIIAGGNLDEVIQAATMLGELKSGAHASASSEQAHFLQAQHHYSFADLGKNTATLGGAGNKRVSVNLPISGEFHTHESAQAELLLNFAYGAGIGMGSVMSVFLNGEFIHGLKLNQENGAAFRNYLIKLPARKLVPGTNTLDFDFTLRPETFPGEYPTMPGSHLLVQILGSSTITLPKASPIAVLPDLASFSATAFPYIANHHEMQTHIVVSDEKLVGAALSLVGKLVQQSKRSVSNIRLARQLPSTANNNIILLSTPFNMPEELFSHWSTALDRSKRWSFRSLHQIREQGLVSLTSNPVVNDPILSNQAVMLAMRNPLHQGNGTLTILSADNDALLTQRVQTLLQPQIWGQLSGDLVGWEGLTEPVMSMRVSNFYEVGEQAQWDRFMLTLSNNPWYWTLAVLLSILILGLLLRQYLRRHEVGRLSE